jgi:hypothetical protein
MIVINQISSADIPYLVVMVILLLVMTIYISMD